MEEIGKITAAEAQKKNKTRVSIFVDGQYLGSLEDAVWAKSGLKPGDSLTSAVWEDLQGSAEAAAALDKALHRLASRARGRAELERYLADKGFTPAAAQSAIEKLQGWGYVDDAAFAGQYVRDRTGLKPVGRKLLERELRRMGVGEEDSACALGQYDVEDELSSALAQARKDMKRTAGEADARKRRAKVYTGLARRGFSQETIETVLNRLFSGSPDEGGV